MYAVALLRCEPSYRPATCIHGDEFRKRCLRHGFS